MVKRILPSFRKFTIGLVGMLFLSAVFLYAFPAPILFYAAVVLLHAGAGLVAIVCLIRVCLRGLRQATLTAKLGWIVLALGGLVGGALVYVGTTRQNQKWLYLHIGLCLVGIILLLADVIARWLSTRIRLGTAKVPIAAIAVLTVITVAMTYSARTFREGPWLPPPFTRHPSPPPTPLTPQPR